MQQNDGVIIYTISMKYLFNFYFIFIYFYFTESEEKISTHEIIKIENIFTNSI